MLVLLLVLSSASAMSPCQVKTQTIAQKVRSIQAQLFTIHESEKDDFTQNPPVAVTRVPEFRRALAAVTEALLECSPPTATASDLQTTLAALLHANRPDAETHDKIGNTNHVFGDALQVTAKNIPMNPDQLAIELDFSVQCGEDDVLLVFERNEKKWQQRLDWQSTKYNEPSDAFGDIFLYSSVPGPDGHRLIAVAHGHPWCTSRFSYFSVDLIQPASGNQPQKVLAHEDYSYNRGDIDARLTPNATGFTIRLGVPSKDLGAYEYPGIFRFLTTAGKLERTAAASNARDFLEQWLDEDWSVAARWSDLADPSVKQTWDRFRFIKGKHEDVPTIEFGEVRACSDSKKFQIEMSLSTFKGPGQTEDAKLFGFVRQNDGTFTMLGFAQTHAAECHSALIMKAPQH